MTAYIVFIEIFYMSTKCCLLALVRMEQHGMRCVVGGRCQKTEDIIHTRHASE